MPKAQAARTFRVSLSSLKRYVDKANRGKSLAPKKRPGPSRTRREGHEAARRRSRRTPLPHPPRALRLRGSHDGPIREPLDHVPRYSQDRPHQEKGGRSATERDEFLRASGRVMVAARVESPRGSSSWTNAARTPPWRRSTATRPKASAF